MRGEMTQHAEALLPSDISSAVLPIPHHQGVRKDGRPVRRTVKLDGMFVVQAVACGQHDAVLRGAGEDVAAGICIAIEPVRIVERSAAQSENVGKTLKVEANGRGAFSAKMQRDALSAGIGPVLIGRGRRPDEYHMLPGEYRLDQIGRPGQPLAKCAVTDDDPQRL